MVNEGKSEIEAKLAEMASPKTQTMPGGRAALLEGSLSKPYLGPQGDEHRDPPKGGITPVAPAPVVAREVAPAGAPCRADRKVDMRSVGKLDDFAEGTVIRKSVGKSEIILIRTGEVVRAFGAKCPHAGAPLDGGALCNGKLICPWHKAEFRVSDGVVLEPPALAACRSDIADDFAMAAEDRVRGGSPGLLRSQSARDPTISVRSSAEWAPSLP